MSFALSQQADPNKIFLVQCSELEGRLDPFCYKPEFQLLKKRIYSSSFNVEKLSQISTSIINGLDCRDYNESGIKYLKVSNIKKDYISLNDVSFIPEQKITKDAIALEGDLLLTRKGTFGIAAVVDNDANGSVFSSEIFKIRINQNISTKYMAFWLNTNASQSYFNRVKTGAIMGHISQEALKYVPIPIPPKEIQLQIVAKMDAAYLAKKQKEAEAERLLASIDDYLLSELGISLPTEPENTIENRIFTRYLSDVSGERLDPKSLSNFYKNLRNSISESNFEIWQLSALILDSKSGDWGIDEDTENKDNSYMKCLVIRATEFDNQFNLNVENTRAKYRLISKQKLTSLNVKANDLLLEKSGGSPDQPVGRIAILDKSLIQDNVVCYSNFIHKFTINSKICLPNYLFCYLKTIHSIGLTESMQSQTNGIRNLIIKEYLNQKIPLPPLAKQQEIADRITAIRNQAKQLQAEAKAGLEKAKAEIEAIILG